MVTKSVQRPRVPANPGGPFTGAFDHVRTPTTRSARLADAPSYGFRRRALATAANRHLLLCIVEHPTMPLSSRGPSRKLSERQRSRAFAVTSGMSASDWP